MDFSVRLGTFKFRCVEHNTMGVFHLYADICGAPESFREIEVELSVDGEDFKVGDRYTVIPRPHSLDLRFDSTDRKLTFNPLGFEKDGVTVLTLGRWAFRKNAIAVEQIFRDYFEQHGLIEVAGG